MLLVMAVKNKREEDTKESLELRSKISINIRKYRKEKNLTQEKLAESANISYDFMRRIESSDGKCGFSVFTLYKLALALNVSVDELMDLSTKEDINQ